MFGWWVAVRRYRHYLSACFSKIQRLEAESLIKTNTFCPKVASHDP